MPPLRIGAVGYLNARPLTWALDRHPDRWQVRYDLPTACAPLLASRQVDLALVSSIMFLDGPEYRMVPGVGIGSRGPVASIALFTARDLADIRSVAVDTSSRTAAALVQVLCVHCFGVRPAFVPHGPDLPAMLRAHDAALLIGDPALEADYAPLGVRKIDLGEAWTAMTGLPFVYAGWTGVAGAVTDADVAALQEAQAEGVRAFDAIAREYGGDDPARVALATRYLRDNMKYGLGPDEAAGLQLFLDYAADLGLAPARRRLEFY